MIAHIILSMMLTTGLDDPMTASLARRDGGAAIAGLRKPVTVDRDSLGVPVIRAESIEDAIRAQGFVHAQERFFQMDLGRRYAAGELAALVGPAMAETDRHMRTYRLRQVAEKILERADDDHRALLDAYVGGVNAGLADRTGAPIEYTFLQQTPRPWTSEDSVLVMLGLTDALHFDAPFEEMLGVMRDALDPQLVDFLTPGTTRFDSPLLTLSGKIGENDHIRAPIPGPDVVDLREVATSEPTLDEILSLLDGLEGSYLVPGSNNWAVAGSRTVDGRAILANDPHLMLSVPGIWFHNELEWPDGALRGVSLPGIPAIVIGSNGHIAWGFTNTTADFQDFIIIEVDPDDPNRYRAPDGFEPFERVTETIEVAGGEAIEHEILVTRWGPVDRYDHHNRPLVLKWIGLDPALNDFKLFEMHGARTLDDAVTVMREWKGPSQNALIASRDGRIAWVVTGYLPRRVGYSGKFPTSWADGTARWEGALDERERPVIIDPPGGLLYTANNRTMHRELSARLANFWDPGLRASRIAELLDDRTELTELDQLATQLDTRVILLDFYRDLALAVIAGREEDADAEVKRILENWNGCADPDEQAVALLESFRNTLRQFLIDPLVRPCRELSPGFAYRWLMDEEPLRRILEERPDHFLPQRFETWDALLAQAFDVSIRVLRARYAGQIPKWSEVNRARIHHPAASVAGAMGRLLNMPDDPLPGHFFAVRVATPSFGASMRMVVSPGRERDGIFQMPAGQSGHPMSPHYRDSHGAWVRGEPAPFLAGEAASTLTLSPVED